MRKTHVKNNTYENDLVSKCQDETVHPDSLNKHVIIPN